jgi:hypothetical protein
MIFQAPRLASGAAAWDLTGRLDIVTDMDKLPLELSELLDADVTPAANRDLTADVHELMSAIDRLDDGHRERVEELERRQAS